MLPQIEGAEVEKVERDGLLAFKDELIGQVDPRNMRFPEFHSTWAMWIKRRIEQCFLNRERGCVHLLSPSARQPLRQFPRAFPLSEAARFDGHRRPR